MKQRPADHFICRHSLLQRELPGIKTRQPMSNKSWPPFKKNFFFFNVGWKWNRFSRELLAQHSYVRVGAPQCQLFIWVMWILKQRLHFESIPVPCGICRVRTPRCQAGQEQDDAWQTSSALDFDYEEVCLMATTKSSRSSALITTCLSVAWTLV